MITRQKKRKELKIPLDAKCLLNVGELIPRKNQETLIRSVAQIDEMYLAIAGRGALFNELSSLIVELGVDDRVKVLGYRTDISELCKSCDLFAFSSFHEGLPVSVMEAMAGKMPVVCSKIRGNVDLIDENGGALFDPHSVEDCKMAIERVFTLDQKKLGEHNRNKVESFSLVEVNKKMFELYEI